jgi:O-antigen/teichoic acid export membrane protein
VVVGHVAVSAATALWAASAYAALSADASLPSWRRLVGAAVAMPRLESARLGAVFAAEKNLASVANHLPTLLMGIVRPEAVGYYSAALRTVSLPYPLVSGLARYLDVLMPSRHAGGSGRVLDTFRRTTRLTGAAWLLVTALMGLAAPLILVQVAGEPFRPALPAVYPLLLQSVMVGFGVAIGSALRAVEKPHWLVGLQLLSIGATVPLGIVLIDRLGAPGGAWLHALRYVVLTVAGLALVPRVVGRLGTSGSCP